MLDYIKYQLLGMEVPEAKLVKPTILGTYQAVNYIVTNMRHRLCKLLSSKTYSRDQIHSIIVKMANRYKDQELIAEHNAPYVKINILWNLWTFKQKFIWTLCNK